MIQFGITIKCLATIIAGMVLRYWYTKVGVVKMNICRLFVPEYFFAVFSIAGIVCWPVDSCHVSPLLHLTI